jgi:hypothetical protein
MAVTVAVTGLLAAVPPGQRTTRVRSRKRPGGERFAGSGAQGKRERREPYLRQV